MLTTTVDRVSSNTAESVNQAIRRRTEESISRTAAQGMNAIDRRLRELEEEWDVERYLETLAPSFTLFGMSMGLMVSRKWFLLPLVVQTFFVQHAVQGWCPPLPVLRQFGIRTCEEINHERNALKALRGDFQHINMNERDASTSREALRAAER